MVHVFDVGDALLGGGRSAFQLLTPPWPVLVVGMLLQVDHSQPLRLLDVRAALLRRQTLPLLA